MKLFQYFVSHVTTALGYRINVQWCYCDALDVQYYRRSLWMLRWYMGDGCGSWNLAWRVSMTSRDCCTAGCVVVKRWRHQLDAVVVIAATSSVLAWLSLLTSTPPGTTISVSLSPFFLSVWLTVCLCLPVDLSLRSCCCCSW